MAESFKERVKNTIVQYSKLYKLYYLDYEYLVCSKAFKDNDVYIIAANKDNYLHLTGVKTKLPPTLFFDKCYNSTLTEQDFDFIQSGKSTKEIIGSVRRKINILPLIMNLFSGEIFVEENFKKNNITCIIATGKKNFTFGFAGGKTAKPMTLLKGNVLDTEKAKTIDLVFRKKKGEESFNDVFYGDKGKIPEYSEKLKNYISIDLQKIDFVVCEEPDNPDDIDSDTEELEEKIPSKPSDNDDIDENKDNVSTQNNLPSEEGDSENKGNVEKNQNSQKSKDTSKNTVEKTDVKNQAQPEQEETKNSFIMSAKSKKKKSKSR